jgi:hypothetical protein
MVWAIQILIFLALTIKNSNIPSVAILAQVYRRFCSNGAHSGRSS